jgi:dolichyl-phosphate beta-glucosyltransferase
MPAPFVSIIIPIYNEEHRIRRTLESVYEYIRAQARDVEVIAVDDGSTDSTTAILSDTQAWFPQLRVIANKHRGKAVAVRTGIFAAQGHFVVFTDADLSAPLTELPRLLQPLEHGCDVSIGSREGFGARRIGEPFSRHVLGRGFNYLVRLLLGQPFRDTQCGFKAFRRDAALHLFRQSRLYTEDSPILKRSAVTAFDVEILFLALANKYLVQEVPVEWHYRQGSKVNPLIDSATLLSDVLRVRWHLLLGHYSTVIGESYLSSTE